MYSLAKEEWDQNREVLFRHFFADSLRDTPDDKKIYDTRRQFINSYFLRFMRTSCESKDHFDLQKMKKDTFGIPQDLSRRYFTMAQKEFPKAGYSLGHVNPWLIRHFEYSIQLALDFENDCKLKKLRELRKGQKGLPIAVRKQDILNELSKNQVLIVAGDTGCGKSTQVPQYLLNAGYTGIAVTQPRRLACMALARRVSYETLNNYGSEVAFQIRFESTKSKRTKLVFLTEGLLLRQMGNDSLLQQYNVIILDEVHERHITSDLLIGLLRDLVSTRPDIRLILMSATINLDLFKEYFSGAPVIQVPGRLYPIKLLYRPIKQFVEEKGKKSNKIDAEPFLRALELIDKETPASERGDALIFLNGVSEITTVAETLKTYAELNRNWIILMLHSTLSTDEQDKVFDVAPPGVRKCILSTNIAETSVTIDGVRFVIDSGKVNLMQYEASTGMQRLCEFFVSKASADQRKGRAGRTGPGTCYRLYSQEQYDKMEPFTLSEINRVSLEDMALQMLNLNLGLDVRTFPYIERPKEDSLNESIERLKFQGVVYPDRESHLTALGYAIAKLPVSVPIAKMLVYGAVLDCTDVALTVAAGLSIQSPFTNRSFRDVNTVEQRGRLCTTVGGDPLTLVSVFREWVKEKCDGRSKRWANDLGVDEQRMFEISKLRAQYRQILSDVGLIEKEVDDSEKDSRQRRIERGERRKLEDMKKEARNNADKRRKVLRADRHYDTILDEHEQDELDKEEDPLKADVKSVEFLLSHNHKSVDTILKTHKLGGRSRTTRALMIAIAAGLYPHYAVLDPQNTYSKGKDLFAHTRLKPFCQLHPNGVVPQYFPEVIDSSADSQFFSKAHQVMFYGTLLETTKPYLCNVLPLPALILPLVAKKVLCDDWATIFVDDFTTFQFDAEKDGRNFVTSIISLRQRLSKDIFLRLRGKETNSRGLVRELDELFEEIMGDGALLKITREVRSPKILCDTGFITPDGQQDPEDDELAMELGGEEDAEQQVEEQPIQENSMAYPLTRQQQEDVHEDEIKAKKPKIEESYYEKLLRMQREREETQNRP
ncbi:unnamed protein product, partial [Mesorhabditis belari]|uniref:RNA helicase n=1 Tax=Mesorhabditis belari TaxID=2138241 RepID=A0AAF3J9Y1_9BILA